ncbi:hypothetical protein [Corynebacterium sp.]|uniref:hypothetical protein n=1 Tax=Corynebacterium sp. TaxID=1720 RepID=UPI0026DD99B5|nr:hypothetical protein [Corynebacterium sp.]MDO5076612.1 hypothetical protein [Corynebacterium sp.]
MVAFGLGEMPGTDVAAAADVIAGESELVCLPQLPDRGLGSDAVGRTFSLMPELPIDARARSWVLTTRPQLSTRRLWDRTAADLDECEATWSRLDALKMQVVGPWSLAASVETAAGHRALTDTGALRDITEHLGHAIVRLADDLRGRFDCSLQLQIDEPLLQRLAAGAIGGTTQFDPIPALAAPELGARLKELIEPLPGFSAVRLNLSNSTVVWDAARGSGADVIHVAWSAITSTDQLDALGHAVSEGTRIGLGLTLTAETDSRATAQRIAAWWDTLGLERALLVTAVDIHPLGDLHTRSLLGAAAALRTAREINDMLVRDAGDL